MGRFYFHETRPTAAETVVEREITSDSYLECFATDRLL